MCVCVCERGVCVCEVCVCVCERGVCMICVCVCSVIVICFFSFSLFFIIEGCL